jgi:hypothetical protein
MRIQLELNESGSQLLDEIRSAIGEKNDNRRMSHRELFDYAITFLHWGIKERQKNRIIASLDEKEKNYKELIMPIFTWVVPVHEKPPVAAGEESAVAPAIESFPAIAVATVAPQAAAATVGKKG